MTKRSFESSGAGRLDVILAQEFPEFSRGFWSEECKARQVLVAGRSAAPGQRISVGDKIELLREPKRTGARTLAAFNSPFKIVFEDEDLVVIDKPRGAPSVTFSESDPETAADFLVSNYPDCFSAGEDEREGGLIHRLDNWASGLLVAARNREIWNLLRDALQQGEIQKEYLVLVEGTLGKRHDITLYLQGSGKRVQVSRESKEGYNKTETAILPERELSGRYSGYSILRVIASFAKRHQVRATCAYLGHPLVGDDLYEAKSSLKELVNPDLSGFILHAAKLSFKHPRNGSPVLLGSESEILNAL